MKFDSSVIVLCSGADAPASTPSSKAFTCPWRTVEYKPSPFSTSANQAHSAPRICAYIACARRYCVGTGFVLVFGGGCDGLKWSQLLLLLLHHRYQHIVLWLWLSLVDVYSASFCCCYWQLFWSVKKLCLSCCSCGGGGEPAAAAAVVVIVVDAAIVLYRSVSVFM